MEADEEATRARTAQVELSLAEDGDISVLGEAPKPSRPSTSLSRDPMRYAVRRPEARAVESVRSAQLHLLKVMCDAVIEVDADMQIIEPGKLGLMLYQSSHRNLAGTRFVDLLNPKEVDLGA